MKWPVRGLPLVVLCCCQRTDTTTRFVDLHLAPSCANLSVFEQTYVATGDYEPTFPNVSPELSQVENQTIANIPTNVASLAVTANAGDAGTWLGVTLVPDAGNIDILTLPSTLACSLPNVAFASAMVFGAVNPTTLIAVGGAPTGSTLTPSFLIDLAKGTVSTMSAGMHAPRTQAGFAVLGTSGQQAIVSGGVIGGVPRPDAEIFDASVGGFLPGFVGLADVGGRFAHAAVTLASGDVVLVGGLTPSGLLPPAPALVLNTQTERITFDTSVNQWSASLSASAMLAFGRSNPYALRLADGTILVGGGFDLNGSPVGPVELFDPTFTVSICPSSPDGGTTGVTVPASTNQAFVPLDGGGALYVAGDASVPTQSWLISSNCTAVPITMYEPDISGPLTDLKAFPSAVGTTLVSTGSAWWRFDPLKGFTELTGGVPTIFPDPLSPILSADPGMHVWVSSSDGSVVVWRESVRNAFATDGPYLVTDTSLMTSSVFPPPAFGPTGLLLTACTEASTSCENAVFVSDARYLDVGVDVDATPGTLPFVLLRAPGSTVICPPVAEPPSSTFLSGSHLHVERRGTALAYGVDGAPLSPCEASLPIGVRVAVGLEGLPSAPNNTSFPSNLVVTRLGTPSP